MEVALLLKIIGIGILIAVAGQILSKTGNSEQSMLLSIAGVIVVMLLLVSQMDTLFSTVRSVFGL